MKTKQGVVLAGLQFPMRIVLIKAASIWEQNGQELVITSTLDGVHSPGSLHPYGYAVDLRTRYFERLVAIQVEFELQNALSVEYDVILHKTHIHVEYDLIIKEWR